MLIFLMWMHGRRCRTLPTWNVPEKDTFSWSYVVSFDLFLWFSLVYTLLILFWYLELTFGALYVERIAQNSHLMATYESDKEIRKIAVGNVDNWYTCHLTIPHDILSHLESWDSQQKGIIIERIQAILVALLMKFWNNKKGTNSALYWDACAYLEHGLKDKWDEWDALLVEPWHALVHNSVLMFSDFILRMFNSYRWENDHFIFRLLELENTLSNSWVLEKQLGSLDRIFSAFVQLVALVKTLEHTLGPLYIFNSGLIWSTLHRRISSWYLIIDMHKIAYSFEIAEVAHKTDLICEFI